MTDWEVTTDPEDVSAFWYDEYEPVKDTDRTIYEGWYEEDDEEQ